MLRAILDPKEKRKRGGSNAGAATSPLVPPIEDEMVVVGADSGSNQLQAGVDDSLFKEEEARVSFVMGEINVVSRRGFMEGPIQSV